MRTSRHRGDLSDLLALSEHRLSMRALGRVSAATRVGADHPARGDRVRLAEIVDLDTERTRRRSNVLLLDGPDDGPYGTPA